MTAPDLQQDRNEPTQLGRFARIASGSLFLALALVSALSAYATGSVATKPNQVVLAFVAMAIASACALWSYRLLLNRPRRAGGLLSPTTLRLFAAVYIGLPVASVATGAWRDNYTSLILVIIQGLLYISWGMAMWRLARRRSAQQLTTIPRSKLSESRPSDLSYPAD